jgi:hypothetical protein
MDSLAHLAQVFSHTAPAKAAVAQVRRRKWKMFMWRISVRDQLFRKRFCEIEESVVCCQKTVNELVTISKKVSNVKVLFGFRVYG